MASDVPKVSKAARWTGWVLTVLVAGLLTFSAVMKFIQPPEVREGFEHLGIPIELAAAIGVVEIIVAMTYLIPQTALLGAILVAAYLGGATMTHLRVGDPWFMPPIVGVVAWSALYLRDRRLRALAPIRRW